MKKKSYRIMSALLAIIMCLGMLAGCSGTEEATEGKENTTVAPSTKLNKPPAEEQIISDLNSFGVDVFEQNNTKATDCEIIKRQTNEEDKEDICYVRITCKSEYNCFEYQFRLNYVFYDVGGWILEDVGYENMEEWTETYMTDDGTDLMDKIIWLDESFTTDMFVRDGRGYGVYLGEWADMHYFGLPAFHRSEKCFSIYDHDGNRITDVLDESLCEQIEQIFINEYNEIRLVLVDSNDKNAEYIADQYGNRMSETYASISPLIEDGFGTICYTWDKETDLMGALDQNGDLLLKPDYKTIKDIKNTLEIPIAESKPLSYERHRVVFESFKGDSGSYRKYYYEDETPINLPNDDEVYYDVDTDQGLFYITENNSVRYYDIDGNVRSPYLTKLTNPKPNRFIRLLSYEGHCGILYNSISDKRISGVMAK